MRMIGLAVALALAGCGDRPADQTVSNTGNGESAVVKNAPTPNPPARVQTAQADTATVATSPADAAAFRKRRDECDHFRGEDAHDAERGAFLKTAVERTCKGTDAELKALRRRHAGNAAVIATLAAYEDEVE